MTGMSCHFEKGIGVKNQATVSGPVVKVFDRETKNGKTEVYLVIEEQSGKFTDCTAVKFWRESAKDAVRVLEVGQLVEVAGRIKSREWQGRYYTDFEGDSVKVLGTPARHRDVDADDDLEPAF